MIAELRSLARRVSGLERSLQRPTQEIRDDGDLRLRWGRQPDDTWTVRAHDAGGTVIADLVGIGPVVSSLPSSPVAGQVCRYRHTAGQPPWLCIWDTALNGGAGAWAVVGGVPLAAFAAGGSTTSATFVDLPGGPSLTIPVAGIYDWEVGCDLRNSGANWNLIQPSALADGDAACIRYQFSAGNVIRPAFRRYAGLPTTAGAKVARVRLVGGGTGEFFSVVFAVFPRELRP